MGKTDDIPKLKNILEHLMADKVHSSQLSSYVKSTFGENLTQMELMLIGQVLKAQNERDTPAAIFIRDTMGQKPTDKTEISGTKENPFVTILAGDLEKWSK